jgi:hypothetical protein
MDPLVGKTLGDRSELPLSARTRDDVKVSNNSIVERSVEGIFCDPAYSIRLPGSEFRDRDDLAVLELRVDCEEIEYSCCTIDWLGISSNVLRRLASKFRKEQFIKGPFPQFIQFGQEQNL